MSKEQAERKPRCGEDDAVNDIRQNKKRNGNIAANIRSSAEEPGSRK